MGVVIVDKRTRVLNAMRQLPVDRVPVTFYTHFPDQTDNTVSAQLAWFYESGMDCLCVETDGYMEYPLPNATPTVQDWKGLKPHRQDHPYIAGQLDRAKRIAAGMREGECVFYMLFTPFSTIKHTVGEEAAMALYRQNPQAMAEAMKAIEEDTLLLADLLQEKSGITGFFVSLQNAEVNRFSPDEYREFLAPWDVRLMAHTNRLSDYNITHMCSWTGVPNNLALWRNYDYHTVNWALHVEQDMDFARGRVFFKPGTTVMGGFDNAKGILYNGGEQAVKACTKNLLEQAGTTGLILSADCSVQGDIPRERLRWVAEACEEYGNG